MPNGKVYQWEYIDLEPGVVNLGTAARGAYLDHIAAWAPRARATRGTSLVASWAELGVTGTWPRCVNLWEQDDLHALARRLELAEQAHAAGAADAEVVQWLETARKIRIETQCKLLFPAAYSPTLAELLQGGVTGGAYYHQTLQVTPRRVEDYLARLGNEGMAAHEAQGMRLVGAFRTGLCNDSEAIVIWALRDFDHWVGIEKAQRSAHGDGALSRWRESLAGLVRDWESLLLLPGPKSPLQTGKLL